MFVLQNAPWNAPDETIASYYAYLEELTILPEKQVVLGKHLTAADMLRLGPPGSRFCDDNLGWLSDETVNTRVAQLLRQQNAVSCHVFNSFFLVKLFFGNEWKVVYENVRRWTLPGKLGIAAHGQQSVLSCRLLMAPCNLFNNHWTLVVADLEQKKIIFLDPKVVSCVPVSQCYTCHHSYKWTVCRTLLRALYGWHLKQDALALGLLVGGSRIILYVPKRAAY